MRLFLAPAQRVQFLLSQEEGADIGSGEAQMEAHRIFSEMAELHGTDANQEWKETARYTKLWYLYVIGLQIYDIPILVDG